MSSLLFRFFIFPCIQFSLSRCICSLILPSSHHMILFSIFPFDQYKLFIAIYKNGTMILRVAFPICTNCPPSKNTCFNGIFAYVRNAMARSAPIEDTTTSSFSLIPCLSLLFNFFKIYCLFLHRNFYHLKTILQKFLFECKERMFYGTPAMFSISAKVNLKSSVLFLLIHFHKGLYLLIIIIHLLSKTIYNILYHQSDLLHLPQHFPWIKYFLIFSIPSASI